MTPDGLSPMRRRVHLGRLHTLIHVWDLRDVAAQSGWTSVAASLFGDLRHAAVPSNLTDPLSLLDAVAADQLTRSWRWHQDRIVPLPERTDALGGVIVAAENQITWEAMLRSGARSVEFVKEWRGVVDDDLVVEYRPLEVSMPLDELLVRILLQQWVLVPQRHRLRCTVREGSLDPFVLLEGVGLPGGHVAFSDLTAGPGWAGIGRGPTAFVTMHAHGERVPFELGTDWQQLVTRPATPAEERALGSWERRQSDPEPADQIGTDVCTWEPLDPSQQRPSSP